jgi:DNA-binding XRE family transcriptional regulator
MQTYQQLKDKYLQDPETRREYDALEAEYQIIRQLIELRLKAKMSQEEFAKRMGTKQSAISRFENNFTNPTVAFLSRVAAVFDKKLTIKFE